MVTLTGISDFRTAIDAGIASQRQALRAELDREGTAMADEIRAAAPRKTGDLENSIGYTVIDTENCVKLRIHVGDKIAYYASFVEYGHGSTPAHPFVRPVVARRKAALPNAVAAAVTIAWGAQA